MNLDLRTLAVLRVDVVRGQRVPGYDDAPDLLLTYADGQTEAIYAPWCTAVGLPHLAASLCAAMQEARETPCLTNP